MTTFPLSRPRRPTVTETVKEAVRRAPDPHQVLSHLYRLLDRAHAETLDTEGEVPSSRQLMSRDASVLERCTPTLVTAILGFEDPTALQGVNPQALLDALDAYRRPNGTVNRGDIPGWPTAHPALEVGRALTDGLLDSGEPGEAQNPATTAALLAIAHRAITAVGLHFAGRGTPDPVAVPLPTAA